MRERVGAFQYCHKIAGNTQGLHVMLSSWAFKAKLYFGVDKLLFFYCALYGCWGPLTRRDIMVQGFRQVNGRRLWLVWFSRGKINYLVEHAPSPLTLIRHSVSQLMDG